MTDEKISELTAATLPLAGTEQVPVVQDGETRRAPASALGSGGGGSSLLAAIVDEKSSGTGGGSVSSGSYATRTLNTVAFDPDAIVTLSSNTFSADIDCGVTWSAPLVADGIALNKTRLVRVSDSAVIEYGSAERSQSRSSTRSTVSARIEAGVSYRIEHYALITVGTATYGDAVSTNPEIYTIVNLWS